MPTLCDLAGIHNFQKKYLNAQLDGDCFDGISFSPTLLGNDNQQTAHEWLYWEFHETNQIALRMGDWKLVVIKGKPHLYNLASDIHEDYDIASAHPEIVSKMIDIVLQQHRDSPDFKVTLPSKE